MYDEFCNDALWPVSLLNPWCHFKHISKSAFVFNCAVVEEATQTFNEVKVAEPEYKNISLQERAWLQMFTE